MIISYIIKSFSFIFFITGLPISFVFSNYINRLQIKLIENFYKTDSRILADDLNRIISDVISETTLSTILSFEYLTFDEFVFLSEIETQKPGVNNIALLEYISKSQIPNVEKDFLNIYNTTINVRAIPPAELGNSSWVLYYINPIDLSFVGLTLDSNEKIRPKLEETFTYKRKTVITDLLMMDDGEIGIAIFEPIMGNYSSVSILASVRRYKDLFVNTTTEFFEKYPQSNVRFVIDNVTVYDSLLNCMQYDVNQDRINSYEEGDLKFEMKSIINNIYVIVSTSNIKLSNVVYLTIMISMISIILLFILLILIVNHWRTTTKEQLYFNNCFISKMSHELKTLMNGVLGSCDLLLHEDNNDTQLCKLKTIKSCGKTLVRLVDDVIDLCHINSNNFEIHREYVDIKDIFINVLDDTWNSYMFANCSFKDVSLNFLIEKDIPSKIKSDGKRISQVLCNLVSNSIKYTNSGNINVTLMSEFDGNDTYLHLNVSDTGIGMDKNKLSKLFDNFSLSDVNNSKNLGLGMKLSKKLCDKLGCTITCKSTLNIGTSISVKFLMTLLEGCLFTKDQFLKIYECSREDVSEFKESQEYKPIEQFSIFKPIKEEFPILIVDDVKLNRKIMAKYIRDLGFKIETSSDGKCALNKCKSRKYSMIMMDISMPVMGGIESLDNIKKSTINKETPVVFVTAEVINRKSEVKKKFPDIDLISKPVDRESIQNTIKKNIIDSKTRRESLLTEIGSNSLRNIRDSITTKRDSIVNVLEV